MPRVVDVPLTTTLADLDDVLRRLLKRELGRHGFEGVEIAFDAPSREWSGKLTGPTVDLFLYDVREAVEASADMPLARQLNGQAISMSPPLRLEVTYAITAWTKAVEDEHRLLSQILAILHTYSDFPDDVLEGRAALLGPVNATLGRPMEEKADFWTAVGGQYKPSVDYALTLTLDSGAYDIRGPEVRTQVIRQHLTDAPRRTMTEMTRFGGKVLTPEGEPVANAWVAMPDTGAWTASGSDGRFIFDRVQQGKHRLMVRTIDLGETEATVQVPGPHADIVLGAPRGKKR
jgi:hypothetical protein